ncbi:MAG: glycosyltransferase family 4 protein [Candidatus Shapirobacteria bacterium]|nr:glycosyltransferase family 4 protein [Candidatus Shapirobacteria bacterium]
MNALIKKLSSKRKSIRVIYVSTYIPQKCGIATFTKDVTNAINMLNPYALAEVMAVVKPGENPDFPWEVKYRIEKENLNSYLEAAKYINNSCADAVMIEHEFGIFGGNCGEYLIAFMKAINKPVVITCHTIPEDPKSNYGKVLTKLCQLASGVTVMMEQSIKKLVTDYGVERRIIVAIPHGTPDLPFTFPDRFKKDKGLGGRFVLGNINLISENKGLEYTIEAVAEIAKKIPEVLYLAIGQTHPGILAEVGEKYRNWLKQKVKKLGIQKNVRFINKYVPTENLIVWLQTMDVYITPYLDPQQSSSGALAYAVGAGKLCISTPYRYAKEVLANGRGMLVPFRDSKAIAKAVIDLYENKDKRIVMQKRAYEYGRFMTWSAVALQHLDIFETVIKKYKINDRK